MLRRTATHRPSVAAAAVVAGASASAATAAVSAAAVKPSKGNAARHRPVVLLPEEDYHLMQHDDALGGSDGTGAGDDVPPPMLSRLLDRTSPSSSSAAFDAALDQQRRVCFYPSAGNFSSAGLGHFSASAPSSTADAPSRVFAAAAFPAMGASAVADEHCCEMDDEIGARRDHDEGDDEAAGVDDDDDDRLDIAELVATLERNEQSGKRAENDAVIANFFAERAKQQQLQKATSTPSPTSNSNDAAASSFAARSVAAASSPSSSAARESASSRSEQNVLQSSSSLRAEELRGTQQQQQQPRTIAPFVALHLRSLAIVRNLLGAASNQLALVPNAACLSAVERRFVENRVAHTLQRVCSDFLEPNRPLLYATSDYMMLTMSRAAIPQQQQQQRQQPPRAGDDDDDCGGDDHLLRAGGVAASSLMASAVSPPAAAAAFFSTLYGADEQQQRMHFENSIFRAVRHLFGRLEATGCVTCCPKLAAALPSVCEGVSPRGAALAAQIRGKAAIFAASSSSSSASATSQRDAAAQQRQEEGSAPPRPAASAALRRRANRAAAATTATASVATSALAATRTAAVESAGGESASDRLAAALRRGQQVEDEMMTQLRLQRQQQQERQIASTSTVLATSDRLHAELAQLPLHAKSVAPPAFTDNQLSAFLQQSPVRSSSNGQQQQQQQGATAGGARGTSTTSSAAQSRQQSAIVAPRANFSNNSSNVSSMMNGNGNSCSAGVFVAPGTLPRFVRSVGSAETFRDVLVALKAVAPALDSGCYFVPLDALTVFAARYRTLFENQQLAYESSGRAADAAAAAAAAAEQQATTAAAADPDAIQRRPASAVGGGDGLVPILRSRGHLPGGTAGVAAELGRRIIKRICSMQTVAVNVHVDRLRAAAAAAAASSATAGAGPAATARQSSAVFGGSSNIPRAACEGSVAVAELLLRHCAAPTLAQQLLSATQPLFDNLFAAAEQMERRQMQMMMPTTMQQALHQQRDEPRGTNTNSSNGGSGGGGCYFEGEREALDSLRARIAAVKIRAACSQQPPSWREAAQHLDDLLLTGRGQTTSTNAASASSSSSSSSSSSTSSPLFRSGVSDIQALLMLLEVTPAHTKRPHEWMQFARRLFPEASPAARAQSDARVDELLSGGTNSSAGGQIQQIEKDATTTTNNNNNTPAVVVATLEEYDPAAEEAELERELLQDRKRRAVEEMRRLKAALPTTQLRLQVRSTSSSSSAVAAPPSASAVEHEPAVPFASASSNIERTNSSESDGVDADSAAETASSSSSSSSACPPPLSGDTLYKHAFAALCRSICRSAEVHHQQFRATANSSTSNVADAPSPASVLCDFIAAYRPQLLLVPHSAIQLLATLVNCVQVAPMRPGDQRFGARAASLSSEQEQQLAVAHAVASLLQPLLVSMHNGIQQRNQQSAMETAAASTSRSLSICITSFVTKCTAVGLWDAALRVLTSPALSRSSSNSGAAIFPAVRAVADARTWGVVAHAAHRPRPANWVAALTAASCALACGQTRGAVELGDVTEAATGALRALSWSDIAYSQRADLAARLFARARSLSLEDGNATDAEHHHHHHHHHPHAQPSTCKRMLAAAVDAFSMRMPSPRIVAATASSSSPSSWSNVSASEMFSNFVRSRALDVTTAGRWLQWSPASLGSNTANSAATSSSSSPERGATFFTAASSHRAADAAWRGRFGGKGRLGDEQRLTTSLVRALSHEAERKLSRGAGSGKVNGKDDENDAEACLASALMACGGNASALLRASSEAGAWVTALSALSHLVQQNRRGAGEQSALRVAAGSAGDFAAAAGNAPTSASSSSSSSPARRTRGWIDDAALACLWAPNEAAYIALRRAFPSAQLPPLLGDAEEAPESKSRATSTAATMVGQSGAAAAQTRAPRGGGMPATYTAIDQDPDCDSLLLLSAVDASLRLAGETSRIATTLGAAAKSQSRTPAPALVAARLRPKAAFEEQDIVDLTERLYWMRKQQQQQ